MNYYYCPACGNLHNYPHDHCTNCRRRIKIVSSKHDVEYYAEKAYQLYRDKSCSYRVLFDEEIFVNPLFSYDAQESAFHDDLNKDGDSCFTFVYNNDNHDNHNDDHTPRCPTCSSTNIKKLSFANRYLHYRAIGFLSKTARSQWICQSCGHKW